MDLKLRPKPVAKVGDEVNFKHGRFDHKAQGIVKEVIVDREFFTNRVRTRYFIETQNEGNFIAEPYDLLQEEKCT